MYLIFLLLITPTHTFIKAYPYGHARRVCGQSSAHLIFTFVLFFFSNLTLKEVIDLIENDETQDFDRIVIQPPDAAELSDEDSAEEDEGGRIDNLCGRQLQCKAEIVTKQHLEETTSRSPSKKKTQFQLEE